MSASPLEWEVLGGCDGKGSVSGAGATKNAFCGEDLPQEKEDNRHDPEGKKAALKAIIADYNRQYGTNHDINNFDLLLPIEVGKLSSGGTGQDTVMTLFRA
jgi:hypothetical protein